MSRPKRPGWSKITITVSEEVGREIRVRSGYQGIEMGTFVDEAIRALPGFPFASRQLAPPSSPAVQSSSGITGPTAGTVPKSLTKPKGKDADPEPIGGGSPTRIAEFICDWLSAKKPLRILLPLQHLAVTDEGPARGISTRKFKALITKAVRKVQEAGFEIGSVSDDRTIKILNTIVQTADHAAVSLHRLFPVNAHWREVWNREAVGAYGTVIGQLVAESVRDRPIEDAASEAGNVVAQMIKRTWDRRGQSYSEFVRQGHDLMVGELFERDPRRRRREAQD